MAKAEAGERIEALRAELVQMVAGSLSPVAQRYGYSEVPLEESIKWRPQVLVLGNYSSGKSTLINELLGGPVQATGQAPTDDSFTILTYDERTPEAGTPRVTEEREGSVLLNDPQYPFPSLRRHGQRFAAHFRLKRLNAPFLRHLALVDTPGMLDSVAERDRGYDYQHVIGDLAQIADLVLVMFDPHKAGTVREAYASLRETLPARTFEDRVIFVLNRIDECESLQDLLRVYGTLCWNLSQMLGRKDIPRILMTWAPERAGAAPEYLEFVHNERDELRRQILLAPKYRLDHLAAFVEQHGERLAHFLEALLAYKRERRRAAVNGVLVGAGVGLAVGLVTAGWLWGQGLVQGWDVAAWIGAGAWLAVTVLWAALMVPGLVAAMHRRIVRNVDQLTPLNTQSRRDSWGAVRELVAKHLETTSGRFKAGEVKGELSGVKRAYEKSAKEVRAALNELATVRHG